MSRIIGFVLFLISFGAPAAVAQQQISAGDFGGACIGPERTCNEGVCGPLVLCVSCGLAGQPVCIGSNGRPYCTFPTYGYRPMEIGGRLQYCLTVDTEDCGQIGLPACDNGDAPFCRQGVPMQVMGRGTFCQACGDFGQACCPDTAYPCDYGTCQNNICLPDTNGRGQVGALSPTSRGSQPSPAEIRSALDDCRLADARALLAALPNESPEFDDLAASVSRAIRRENDVRILYDDAQAKVSEARVHLQADRIEEAALAFALTENLLKEAQRTSTCPLTIATIEEAIAINSRNGAKTFAAIDLRLAADHISFCNFDQAGDLLEALPTNEPGKAALQAQLDAALDRESRVIEMYRAAQNLNSLGKTRMTDNDFAGAADLFAEAREGFLKARQLTECLEHREVITEAIAVTGRNLDRAQTRSNSTDFSLPDRYTPATDVPKSRADPTLVDNHPCLDPSAKRDAYVKGYSGMGGGGSSFDLKGRFICGFNGSFTMLSDGMLIGYVCTRDGQRYSSCEVDWAETISSEGAVHDGYVYRYRDNSSWIVVHADD
ncbi:hypothetical protein RXV86_02620 [Alisedimentitalea sp. MJ-SS2]|uniref:hypothetical protein n=1 Tax=Aliisedimentitalea sp. MJ-SS2 TaxID=3049795 RepID=UPI0029150645|nr:hypothetical protein [Alisedimentitalea sp. MJ-SS2]MDU8926269.1 hypothetical protein [Alisedimentitalea sp. MJ-SS2]